MTPDRMFDLFEEERQANDEFREEMLRAMGELKTDIAVLKSQRDSNRDGAKLIGWILVFAMNVVSVGITYLISKP